MQMENNESLVIGMVGLPARGKSYLSRKIARYLNWVGMKSKVFNNGLYRRVQVGTNCDSHFFDQNNQEGQKARENCAIDALNDVITYLSDEKCRAGQIAIIDATNTRVERRRFVENYLKANLKKKYTLIWVETICNIPKIIEDNIIKTKVFSPDYVLWDPNKAVEDFRERIREYEKVYETLSKDNDGETCRFIKLIDQNATIILQNIRGYLESRLLSFLINLHTGERPIYFIRNGQSEDSVKGKLGGDSDLSENGQKFTNSLESYFANEAKMYSTVYKENFVIFCSTLKRSLQTAET
jgi:6-phosphofructo-2-kinase/fructose-2,6-biphosphatase 2/6-phosphofructo-2-kinase/fructose-2,6-biphosphatase 4